MYPVCLKCNDVCRLVSDEGLPTNKDNQPAQEKCDVCGAKATTLTGARRGPKNFCDKCCPSYYRPIKIYEREKHVPLLTILTKNQ